jgi:hypothetical protein
MILKQVMFPLPFIPSHHGRGNMTFYKVIKVRVMKNWFYSLTNSELIRFLQ